MSILVHVLQSSWWGRKSYLLCFICLPGVLWWLSGSSSRYNGFVCGSWWWYFLIILTYYFWTSTLETQFTGHYTQGVTTLWNIFIKLHLNRRTGWSILAKQWDRTRIKLTTPGSAVRNESAVIHVTDCATQPGIFFSTKIIPIIPLWTNVTWSRV